jgi:hypothetical protein
MFGFPDTSRTTGRMLDDYGWQCKPLLGLPDKWEGNRLCGYMVDRTAGEQDGERERGNLPNCGRAYRDTDQNVKDILEKLIHKLYSLGTSKTLTEVKQE